ncbi:MAG: hypothetical protein ACXWL5_03830 [Candidatus Chromulinivorax sp.]
MKKQFAKLTMLALMSFALDARKQVPQDELDEVESLQLQAAGIEQATAPVLADLAELSPQAIDQIVKDEESLHGLRSILKFVERINKEISQMLENTQDVDPVKLARLAVESADAQAALERIEAKLKVKHKKGHEKIIQNIQDKLFQAEQSLKNIAEQAESSFDKAKQVMKDRLTKAKDKVKKRAAEAKKSLQAAKKKISEKIAEFANDDTKETNDEQSASQENNNHA